MAYQRMGSGSFGGTIISENSYVCLEYASSASYQSYTDGTQVTINKTFGIAVLINVKNKSSLSTTSNAYHSICGFKNNEVSTIRNLVQSSNTDITNYDYVLICSASGSGPFSFNFTVS